MAKRRLNGKRSKIEPAVMTLYVPTRPVGGVTPNITEYIDLSQIASLVNRRFYRQGLNWAVAGIKVLNLSGFQGSILCAKLPNTWVMSNAWEKSFRSWQRMNNEALAESDSAKPRFLDFKIYADDDHHTAGYTGNLLPSALDGTFTVGEWEASKISIPLVSPAGAFNPGDTVERELIAVGPSYPGVSAVTGFDAVSLIEGYAASRALPDVRDPNLPGDLEDTGGGTPENWMQAIFNEGTDQSADVLEDMRTENNQAPYPYENDGVNLDTMYPGGANQGTGLQIHDINFVTPTTIGGQTHIKGGNFPCGLMRFDIENTGDTSNLVLQIDLMPGSHRGYLAESMTEM